MTIFSYVIKKGLAPVLRRRLHLSGIFQVSDTKKPEKSLTNPFCLDPIVTEAYQIKQHDNQRRQRLYEFGLYVAACNTKYVQKLQIQHCDELEVMVVPEGLFPVMSFLCHHQHACFNVCGSMTAIDVPSRPFRFEVVYNLLSLRFAERIRVKTYTDELTPIHSGYPLYKVCNLFERECYDMFGIIFTNHPDLRRVLTDYGFNGHPLRKDFPLVGYHEVRYDDELKKLVYEPVEYAQQARAYHLKSPWNHARNFYDGFSELPKKK